MSEAVRPAGKPGGAREPDGCQRQQPAEYQQQQPAQVRTFMQADSAADFAGVLTQNLDLGRVLCDVVVEILLGELNAQCLRLSEVSIHGGGGQLRIQRLDGHAHRIIDSKVMACNLPGERSGRPVLQSHSALSAPQSGYLCGLILLS